MIRLGLARKIRDIDIGNGVTLTVKPLTYAVYRAACSTAYRQSIAIAMESGMIEQAGGTISDIPDPDDKDGIRGLSDQFMLQALARHAIVDWSGVVGEDGGKAEVSPQLVDALIRDCPTLATRFDALYLADIEGMVAEGNGSGAAPSGIGEAAPNTAEAAGQPDSPAPTEVDQAAAGAVNTESTSL